MNKNIVKWLLTPSNYLLYSEIAYRRYFKSKKYKSKSHFWNNIKWSNLPLEIIIPCIDKDKTTIWECIDSLRDRLKHPITSINIICPHNQDNIEKIAKDKWCNIIYEDAVVPIKKEEIKYITKEWKNRAGRLFQQLIKLFYAYKTNSNYYYVIDSDTILMSEQVFEDKWKIIYLFSDENHKPYYKNYEKLLWEKKTAPMSFVAHQMVFNKNYVNELIKKIENIHNTDFISALINTIDTRENSWFSEFELYGNYMYKYHKDEIMVEYRFNKRVKESEKNYEKYKNYRSVSKHHY